MLSNVRICRANCVFERQYPMQTFTSSKNISNPVLNRFKEEKGKHPSAVSFIVSTLHADSDRCIAGGASTIPSGLTGRDVSLQKTVDSMK